MKKSYLLVLFFLTFVPLFAQNDSIYKSTVEEIMQIPPVSGLSDLLNTEVTTVSNTAEKIGEAPASTIVITREQILQRGYSNLLDLLHDLPDIDLSFIVCRIFRHFSVSLRAVNLLNQQYFHSGVRNANSGGAIETSWTGRAFNGSSGFYNSLLPQATRSISLTLRWDL